MPSPDNGSKETKMIQVGDYIYKKVGAAEYLTWPVYPSEEVREHEEVENVFNLGGGELEEGKFAGYAYWYQGAPDYADEAHDYDNEYITVLVFGGGLLPTPSKTLEHEGEMWELSETYMSSGEADCWVCGAGGNGKEWWAGEFEDTHGEPPRPDDMCGLCETEYQDMPGVVYIGEGYEAVYRFEKDEEEDYE
jgi:hypothetical protein